MSVGKREVQFGLLGLLLLTCVLIGVLYSRYTGMIPRQRTAGMSRPEGAPSDEMLGQRLRAASGANNEPGAPADPAAPPRLADFDFDAQPLPETGSPPAPEIEPAPRSSPNRLTGGATRLRSVRANGEPRSSGLGAAASDHVAAPAADPGADGFHSSAPSGSDEPAPTGPGSTGRPRSGATRSAQDWAEPGAAAGAAAEAGAAFAQGAAEAGDWPPGPAERVAQVPSSSRRSIQVDPAPRSAAAATEEAWTPTEPEPQSADGTPDPASSATEPDADAWTDDTYPASPIGSEADPAAGDASWNQTPAPYDSETPGSSAFAPGADEAARPTDSRYQQPADDPWADAGPRAAATEDAPTPAYEAEPADNFRGAGDAGSYPADGAPAPFEPDSGGEAAQPRTETEQPVPDAYESEASAGQYATEEAWDPPAATPLEEQEPPRPGQRLRFPDRQVRLAGDAEETAPTAARSAAGATEAQAAPRAAASGSEASPPWSGLSYEVTPVAPPAATHSAAAPPATAPAASRPRAPRAATAEAEGTAEPGWTDPAAARRAPTDSAGELPPGEAYVVGPQETFWTIAQKAYGNGGYFKALYEHNRQQHPRADQLRPGDELALPPVETLEQLYPDLIPRQVIGRRRVATAGAARQPAPPPVPSGRTYIVQEGDTLFDIARYELGRATRWSEIYQLNRDLIGEDMNRLKAGMELALPAETDPGALSREPGDAWRR